MMLPVLACAAAPTMSRMERDCCEQMHGKCGDMAKQGCCRVEAHNDRAQLPSNVTTSPIPPIAPVTILYPRLVELSPSAGFRWRVPNQHSPPGILITGTTVLRI